MRHVIIGTAGHIDHGKSALVHALTGTDPDRLKEEKARGITIDLGFAHWSAGELTCSFVDVPGHERFVKNMLAGVGGIDAVALVVAADESVMPQTREHFEICRLLHVPDGLVVITKADLADADTIELVQMEVRELLAGSFLEQAPVVVVSSRTGEGLEALRQALVALGSRIRPRGSGGSVRLAVDRAFTVKGFGTVATGTLLSGRVQPDDELSLQPEGRRVKVRGVQVHGAREQAAVAGQRVALNLGGVEVGDLGRGDWLITPETLQPTRVFDARLQVVDGVRPLRHGARVRFHQGTAEILGRLALAAVIAPDGQLAADLPAGADVAGGASAYVRIRLEAPAVLARADRFILRAYSPPVTIAGGAVLDPHPARGPIRTAAAQRRFARLDPGGDPAPVAEARALAVMIAEAGVAGLPLPAVTSRAGVAPETRLAAIERQQRDGTGLAAGSVLVAPDVLEGLRGRVLALASDHHRADPLSEGVPREEVRERVFARAGEGVFEWAVADLVRAGLVVGRDRIALATHRAALSGSDEEARRAIEAAYRASGLEPADLQTVAAGCGVPLDVADRIVKWLIRQKVLVRVDTLLFDAGALEHLRAEVAALKPRSGGEAKIDVAAFKARFGVTRKYAIPLLEYLDRERVTRRVGDARLVL